MKTIEAKQFKRQLAKFARRGGVEEQIYRDVVRAIIKWEDGKSPQLTQTKHGENRIPHAVKYHLRDYYRLVTIEHKDQRILLWLGTHEEVDHWLDEHRGYDFAVDRKNRVQFIPATPNSGLVSDPPIALPYATGPILDRLSSEYIDRLKLSPQLLAVAKMLTFEKLNEDESWLILNALQYESDEHREVLIDVLMLLMKDQVKQAEMRIDLFAEAAVKSSENQQALVEAIESGNASDELLDLSTFSREELEAIFAKKSYADWLLYLHPTQTKLVRDEFNGSARLVGVSGSGKTCVLVHRARVLINRYPGERVLVLVLNDSLKFLLENLIAQLCTDSEQRRIDVRRIYEYCYNAVKKIRPKAKIENRDRISGEDLHRCWRDFTRKEHAMRQARPLITPLKLRDVDPWSYLQDELIWVRTGFGFNERLEYLSCERTGRGINFPRMESTESDALEGRSTTGFPHDTRRRVLKLLGDYEEYMKEGGLLDEDGVALEAYEIRQEIRKNKKLKYRCVLVDEVQDCSTIQLGVIASIPLDEQDGLYLVGDPVQKVFPRQQHLPSAGIDIRGRSTILRVNYRNTRQVLMAAHQIIDFFRDKCPVPEEEILNPEYAFREGAKPKLIQFESERDQHRFVEEQLKMVRDVEMGTTCVATMTGEDLHELTSICNQHRWPARKLSNRSTLDEVQSSVMMAHFEDMKGHEFRFVYLLNLTDRDLLVKSIPVEERWRIAFQLYVAMTRAQDELWLCSVQEPSSLLQPLLPYVDVLKPQDVM